MKTNITLLFLALAAPSVCAQGSLTPPGAPAPDMKTLQQIEPRIPISALPYVINQSGSYYLTGNLVFNAVSGDAITINAAAVTIDFMGFTLSSESWVSGDAIRVPGSSNQNIWVRNGHIKGNTTVSNVNELIITRAGFGRGINDSSIGARYENMSITGCRGDGLYALIQAMVLQVNSSGNGDSGIVAAEGTVSNSTANSNGKYGIDASNGSVTSSNARNNGETGILAQYGSVMNSSGSYNNGSGIDVYWGSVMNSVGFGNDASGIRAAWGTVMNSTCRSNHGDGIFVIVGTVTNSRCSLNAGYGIYASGGSVTHCVSTDNTRNDLYATDAAVAFSRYDTFTLTGSTLTGNAP